MKTRFSLPARWVAGLLLSAVVAPVQAEDHPAAEPGWQENVAEAARTGLMEKAAQLLADAARGADSGTALQQQAYLLLQMGRDAEASAALKQAAAILSPDIAAECASVLQDVAFDEAAAVLLRGVMKRAPQNYRLAWFAAALLSNGGESEAALAECLRLASAPFPPMPPATGEFRRELDPDESVLLPLRRLPAPVAAENAADSEALEVLIAMMEFRYNVQRNGPMRWVGRASYENDRTVPAVPDSVAQLRGWAAREALQLARRESEECFSRTKTALVNSGIRAAALTEDNLRPPPQGYPNPGDPGETVTSLAARIGIACRSVPPQQTAVTPQTWPPRYLAPRAHALSSLVSAFAYQQRSGADASMTSGEAVAQLWKRARQATRPPLTYDAFTPLGLGLPWDQPIPDAVRFDVAVELRRRADAAARPRDAMTAGVALLWQNESTAGKRSLQHALALAPHNAALRRLAVGFLARVDCAAAMEMARPLTPCERVEITGSNLANQAGERLAALELSLPQAEWLLEELRACEPFAPTKSPFGAQFTGMDAERVLAHLESGAHGDGGAVLPPYFPGTESSVYAGPDEEPRRSWTAAELAVLSARRASLLPPLYLELLRDPAWSGMAFQRMARAAESGRLEWSTLLEDALRVAMQRKDGPLTAGEFNPVSAGALPLLTLLEEGSQRPQWMDGEILPALRAAGHPQLAANLAVLAPLFVTSEKDYAAAARSVLLTAADDTHTASLAGIAANVAMRRKFTAAYPALALEIAARRCAPWLPRPLLAGAAAHLHALGGDKALDEWVAQFSRYPQPDGETGFKMLAATASERPWSDGGNGTNTCLRLAFSLRRLQASHPGKFPPDKEPLCEWPQTAHGLQPAAAADLLEAAGFLTSLPDIRFALPEAARFTGSPSETIPLWLQRNAEYLSPQLIPLLEEKYAGTFGGRLAAALLRDFQSARRSEDAKELPPSRVLEALGAELPAIKRLPPGRQRELASLAVDREWPPFRQRPQGAAAAAWSWHTQQARARWLLRAEELLANPHAGALNAAQDMPFIYDYLLPEDSDVVFRLLDHLEANRFPDWLSFLNRSQQYTRAMNPMQCAWTRPVPDEIIPLRVRALLRLTRAPAARGTEPRHTSESFAILRQWWNVSGEQPPADWPDRVLHALHAAPGDLLTDAEARALLPSATTLIRWLAKRDRRAVLQAAQRFSDAPGNAPLRNVLARACRLTALEEERFTACKAAWQQAGQGMEANKDCLGGRVEDFPQTLALSDGPLLPAQEPLMEFLTDETLPAALRRWWAGELAATLPDVWDAPLLDAALPLLEATQAGPRNVQDFSEISLALAALRFSAPQDARGKAREQRLVQSVLRIQSPFRPDPLWLSLAARCCDDAALQKAVEAECAQSKEALTGLFRVLVNSRRFSAARMLVENYPLRLLDELHPWRVRVPGELYQAATPDCLRDFQATLPKGPLRLLAAAVMFSARDAPDIIAAKVPGHYARCRAFTPKLYAEPLPDEWIEKLRGVYYRSQP